MPNQDCFRILAIDGGGIRGVYPATFLAELEQQASRPLGDCFDLVTGTSTGGIIALGLAQRVPAEQILHMYLERGPKIFPRHPFWKRLPLFSAKYGNEVLADALREVFGGALLGESACRVCIPSVDVRLGTTRVFKTDHHPDFHQDWKLPVWQVAMATSAAPLYFPAAGMDSDRLMVDGGLWANNPGLVGVLEALYLGNAPSQIALLSIGTGRAGFSMRGEWAERSGIWQWGGGVRLLNLLMETQARTVANQISYMRLAHYLRVDHELPKRGCPLDDARHIETLRAFGKTSAQAELLKCLTFTSGPGRAAWPRVGRQSRHV